MKLKMRAFVAFLLVMGTSVFAAGRELYVAPTGDDSADGSGASPFRTIQRACDEIASWNAAYPSEGVTVWISGGQYLLNDTLTLTDAHSGLSGGKTVFRGVPGENVQLIGGAQIAASAFEPVTDPSVLVRFPAAAREHVRQLDLVAAGFGDVTAYPDLFTDDGGIINLCSDNVRMKLARYPNGEDSFNKMNGVVWNGVQYYNNTDVVGAGVGKFHYKDPFYDNLTTAVRRGLWVKGYWRVAWQSEALRVIELDLANRTIRHAKPVALGIGDKYKRQAGIYQGSYSERFYTFNIPEAMDLPGEWCIDFPSKTLYFWPPDGVPSDSIIISDLDSTLVHLNDASHITLQDLIIEGGSGNGIEVSNGSDNLIADCVVRNVSGWGVKLSGGSHHGVQSCDLYALGAGGVHVTGGTYDPLVYCNHYIWNNHIHDFGQIQIVYAGGLYSGAVGTHYAHNLIHDGPHMGVSNGGQYNTLEYNCIYRYAQLSNDIGGFYCYNGAARASNNTIRYNLIFDSPAADGIYYDQHDNGDFVYGNICHGLYRAILYKLVQKHYCYNNVVLDSNKGYTFPTTADSVFHNNTAVDCRTPYTVSSGISFSSNLTLTAESVVVNEDLADFRLTPSSIFSSLPDFVDIPVRKIGLYTDEFRTEIPAEQPAWDTAVLEKNLAGGETVEVKSSQSLSQSFRHGAVGDPDYYISRLLLYVSVHDGQLPDAGDVTFSIGNGVNTGAVSGSGINVDASTITDSSGGVTFQAYEIAYDAPVGPLSAGTDYYLNLENSGAESLFVEVDPNGSYESGTLYVAGADTVSRDLKFWVWGDPPAAPANLAASGIADGTITLDWSDPADRGLGIPDVSHYSVKRSTAAGGPYTQIAANVTASEYTDTGLTNRVTYYYVVTAIDDVGAESAPSNEAAAAPTALNGATWIHSGPTAFNGSSDYLTLPDPAAGNGATELTIAVTVTPDTKGSFKGIISNTYDSNQYFGLLTSGYGEGNPIEFRAMSSYILSPDNTCPAGAQTCIAGVWKSGQIQKLYLNGVEVASNPSPPSGTLDVNQWYVGSDRLLASRFFYGEIEDLRIWTRALSASEISAMHYRVENLPPATPSALSVTTSGWSVNLDWNDIADADLSHYEVKRSTSPGGTYSVVADHVADSSFVDYAMSDGVTYYYRVVAVDDAGLVSGDSNEVSVSVPLSPENISILSGDAKVNIDWSDNTAADFSHYNVWRSNTVGGPYTLVAGNVTVSAYEDTGLSNGLTYSYAVTTVNTAGNESYYSDEVSVVCGAPLWSHDGPTDFNGSSDVLNLPTPAAGNGARAVTIVVRVTPDTKGNFEGIVVNTYDNTEYFGLLISGYGSGNPVEFRAMSNYILSPNNTCPVGEATHIAGVWKSGEIQKLYLDGAEVASDPSPPTGALDVNQWIVGSDRLLANRYFDGQIEDLKIYTRALTAAEIAALAAGVPLDDGDTMDDVWEQNIADADVHDAINAPADVLEGDDFDNDGFDNLSEYIAGTDPVDPESVFAIQGASETGSDGYVITWNSVEGRHYDIMHTENLALPFTSIAENLSYPQNSFTSALPAAASFFRVEAALQ